MNQYTVEDINRNPYLLAKIPVPELTHELCMAAVKRAGFALINIEPHTVDLCQVAMRRHGEALQHVQLPTDALMMPASGQLADWVSVLAACESTDAYSIEAVMTRVTDNLSLGKQFVDDWLQQTVQGRLLLDDLVALANELTRLNITDPQVEPFVQAVQRQVELALRRQLERQPRGTPATTSQTLEAEL